MGRKRGKDQISNESKEVVGTCRYEEQLSMFPDEIWSMILNLTPIPSLAVFRRTCRRASLFPIDLSRDYDFEPTIREIAEWLTNQRQLLKHSPQLAFFKPVSDPGWSGYGNYFQLMFKKMSKRSIIDFEIWTGKIDGHDDQYYRDITDLAPSLSKSTQSVDIPEKIIEYLKDAKFNYDANYSVICLNWTITRDILYRRACLSRCHHEAFIKLLINKMTTESNSTPFIWIDKLYTLKHLLTCSTFETFENDFLKVFYASSKPSNSIISKFTGVKLSAFHKNLKSLDFNVWCSSKLQTLKPEDFALDPRVNYTNYSA